MKTRGSVALLGVGVLAGLLAGCRAEEQDRPLQFTPGVYQGEKVSPLDERQRRDLRERGRLQQG